MVNTLFCASELFDGEDDILISYGDIVFNETVYERINKSISKINVVIDSNWKDYWASRMENPLSDAETLKINKDGKFIDHIRKLHKSIYPFKNGLSLLHRPLQMLANCFKPTHQGWASVDSSNHLGSRKKGFFWF